VLTADAVALRDHPERVQAQLGEPGVREWRAKLASVAPPTKTPAAGAANSRPEQLVLSAAAGTSSPEPPPH
jgi:hypothetical protein